VNKSNVQSAEETSMKKVIKSGCHR